MDDRVLQLYIEGATTEEQSKAVVEWLDADASHLQHYQRLCRLYEITLWNETPEVIDFGISHSSTQHTRFKSLVYKSLQIAAVFLLGFLLNLWIQEQDSADNTMQLLQVPAGQHAQITLADGSRVWLNAGSTLYFPSKFSDDKRLVQLQGEGYFEVKADANHPFVVSTPRYEITALGTSFNVHAYQSTDLFETALLKGKVKVSEAATGNHIMLSPNERAVSLHGTLTALPIENNDHFLWRKGIIYFDESLDKVFKKLELYFDVHIVVNNHKSFDYQQNCTGKFRTRDGLEHIMKVLQATYHFSYMKDDEINLITIN